MEKGKREQLSKNFFRDEFSCKCNCGSDRIDSPLIIKFQALRDDNLSKEYFDVIWQVTA
jgi:hypothetical protein